MQTHNEIGGKTLTGRQVREWYASMVTTAHGRPCVLLRFGRTTDRALVRWLGPIPEGSNARCLGNVREGKTQWLGRYEIAPELS